MRQKENLDIIKKNLARFVAQVKISNLNNEYDINLHAENVIIPILNLLYGVKLKNANFSEGKNNVAIDLFDEENKFAIQVTSTKEIDKIKKTISKLLSSQYKNKVSQLYFYILQEKQNSYSQEIISKVCGKNLKFDVKKNILDAADIYRKIAASNDSILIEKIAELLKYQFSDLFINNIFTVDKFYEFKSLYKTSCLNNFSRINFFGLSVRSNKPREIELYQLFVNPKFSTSSRIRPYSIKKEDFINDEDLFGNSIEMELKIQNLGSSYKNRFENILSDKNFSELFSASSVINLTDYKSLSLFEHFHDFLNKSEELDFYDLFSGPQHIVVIGKPGAGKSSFIKFALCKILENDHSIFLNEQVYEFVPFRVELYRYNKFKKNKEGNILEYLVELLKNEYQNELRFEDIKSLINTFPTLFFFDGMDEIFDIQERIEVRNDIETFIYKYKKIRTVVTSRFESYEEVKFSEKLFVKYELLNFNDLQVSEYINKWYSIEEPNSKTRQREIESCLTQLTTVDEELKYNPLLLSLILLLYRSELDIPTSKLNIYESCTNTIVETRDIKEKKLDIKLKIVDKLSVFASLAFWQFTNESVGGSAPNFETVRNQVKDFLIEKGEFEEDYLASLATDEFLEFAKIRSIYFENKFTHKTFLEYFTAYYIYSYYFNNWKKAEEFSSLISDYIGLSAWSVVLELLICKIDSGQINYVVVDDLFEKQYEINKIDVLIFFLSILKYLKSVSPKKIRFIIDRSIEFCFIDGGKIKESKLDYKEVLFGQLCSLALLDRFKEIIEISFNDFITNSKIESSNLIVFAYELAIVSGNTALVKKIQERQLDVNNEYVFILKHYPNLFEDGKYIESLKLFEKNYGTNKLTGVYKSHFNQKIFFNSEKFNWHLCFFAKNSNEGNLYSTWISLIKSGIKKEQINASAKHKSAVITDLEFEKQLTNEIMKDIAFNKFYEILKKTYVPMMRKKNFSKNEKFYDKFIKIVSKR